MTNETTAVSTEVAVVVEPTLAIVRAEREEAQAKAKEEKRIRNKTYALQGLDGFVTGVQSEIDALDKDVKRIADRRKVLEEAISVAKSIETNADLTVEEIQAVTKKASDVYYGRKEEDDTKRLVSRAVREEMVHFIEPRHFHPSEFPRGGFIFSQPSRRGL